MNTMLCTVPRGWPLFLVSWIMSTIDVRYYTTLQSQNAVSANLKSKEILAFGFARHCGTTYHAIIGAVAFVCIRLRHEQ